MALVQDENWSTAEKNAYKSEIPCVKHEKDDAIASSLLVHVIDGFIIEESSVPFRQNVDESERDINHQQANRGLLPTSNLVEADVVLQEEEAYSPIIPTNCKFCGKGLDPDRAFWGKRFCSVSCGKRYSLKCTLQYKRLHRKSRAVTSQQLRKTVLPSLVRPRAEDHPVLAKRHRSPAEDDQPDGHYHDNTHIDEDEDLYDEDEEMFDGVEAQMKYASVPIVTWNTQQVVDFIRAIPGCTASAEQFATEEIDGFALMLLKEEHLVNVMGLKLGPALKIACQLRAIKQEHGVRSRTKYLSSPLFEKMSSV